MKTMRYVYSKRQKIMQTIRILHHHEPGYGWSFDSPDVPGLTGGTESYDAAHAEEAVKFALRCEAEERGVSAVADLVFEHYVPVGVAVSA
jgi:hypothetical protein